MSQQKRQMNHGIQSIHENPDIASLSTIGMRIRKAVADGYSVPVSQNQLEPSSFSNQGGFQRVPLPASMNQPPSLTNVGSTFDSSSSSLAEWDSKYNIQNAPLQTLPNSNFNATKRKYDDSDSDVSFDSKDLGTFKQKYGDLAFNEEF